jgi:hypothetical protein
LCIQDFAGAKRTASTSAMEVLLEIPPLSVMTEAEAQSWIYRLMCSQQWKPKSNFGHARKSPDMEHEPILQMGTELDDPKICIPQATHGQVT